MHGAIAENRSVYGIHEDLSTELTLLSREKTIFRGAHNINPDSLFINSRMG